MQDWKTTISGLVAALGPVTHAFAPQLDVKVSAVVTALGLLGFGIVAKDKK